MAPTLTLTPDIFNNPTQIKTKCITSNKTELLKPFLLPLPMCVLCDLFMLFFVDSCISGCSGFQPFTSLSPRLLPHPPAEALLPHASPSSFLAVIACDPSLIHTQWARGWGKLYTETQATYQCYTTQKVTPFLQPLLAVNHTSEKGGNSWALLPSRTECWQSQSSVFLG